MRRQKVNIHAILKELNVSEVHSVSLVREGAVSLVWKVILED